MPETYQCISIIEKHAYALQHSFLHNVGLTSLASSPDSYNILSILQVTEIASPNCRMFYLIPFFSPCPILSLSPPKTPYTHSHTLRLKPSRFDEVSTAVCP